MTDAQALARLVRLRDEIARLEDEPGGIFRRWKEARNIEQVRERWAEMSDILRRHPDIDWS